MKDVKLEITYMPTDELTPYENNAKLHPQEQIDKIKASITQFGMDDPIAVYGKDNIIIEGHGRLIACQQLGIKTVPVIRLDHLTEDQRKAYTLVHNQLTMDTGFDLELLQKEIEEIDLDMSDFGFGSLIDNKVDIDEDNYEIDESEDRPEAKSKLGEVYKLGEHYLMCGDSTKAEDVDHLMALGEPMLADMVLTDPPYNVNVSNAEGLTIENDNLDKKAFYDFINNAFVNLSRSLKPGGPFYIFYGDSEDVTFRTSAAANGLSIRECLIWVKNSFTLGRQDYQWRHEPCLYGWKEGEGHYFVYDRTQDTVIEQDPVDFDNLTHEEAIKLLKEIYLNLPSTILKEKKPQKNDLHPTMKPLGLVGQLIKNSSKKGETVLDLFGGSGSTLIACESLGRKCRMMEYDPHYVDAIIDRYEQATGKKAEKIEG